MERQISGTMIYNYFVCERKLWYFCRNVGMEHTSENVAIGKLIDENTFMREDKHITIDNVISIDFVNDQIHEVKKSKKIEESGIWQVKYYLYYLRKKGIEGKKAIIHYPLMKEKIEVVLNEADGKEIENILEKIEHIVHNKIPELPDKTGICKNCAYYDLCWI